MSSCLFLMLSRLGGRILLSQISTSCSDMPERGPHPGPNKSLSNIRNGLSRGDICWQSKKFYWEKALGREQQGGKARRIALSHGFAQSRFIWVMKQEFSELSLANHSDLDLPCKKVQPRWMPEAFCIWLDSYISFWPFQCWWGLWFQGFSLDLQPNTSYKWLWCLMRVVVSLQCLPNSRNLGSCQSTFPWWTLGTGQIAVNGWVNVLGSLIT